MYEEAGMFALKAVGNIIGGNKAAAAQYQQYTAASQQQQNQWDQNGADNQAIAAANLTNTIRTGFKVGLLNAQRAQAKKKAIEQGYDISVTRQQALGAATANAAAAGSIGASVSAVASDIEERAGNAVNSVAGNYEGDMMNADTALHDTLNAGADVLRSPEKLRTTNLLMPNGFSYGEAVIGAGIDMGMDYMKSKMSLGLGKK